MRAPQRPVELANSFRFTSFPARTPTSIAWCSRPQQRRKSEATQKPFSSFQMPSVAAAPDRDLASLQEARTLAKRAKAAAGPLAEFSQEQIDRLIDAMAAATKPRAEEFARLAVEETGYGVVADKIQKNLFSSVRVYEFIRPMRTVGVVG